LKIHGHADDIIACPGLDYCNPANARSIPVAQAITERFASIRRQHDIGRLTINISGCINACGHHHVGNIGLLGIEKNCAEFYQITFGGRADENAAIGTIAGPAFAHNEYRTPWKLSLKPISPIAPTKTKASSTHTQDWADNPSRRPSMPLVKDKAIVEVTWSDVQANDANGILWRDAPDACCHIRKVVPLNDALEGFDAWINGRNRIHRGLRADIAPVEAFADRIKINPLANWDLRDIAAYFDRYDLPVIRWSPTDTRPLATCPARRAAVTPEMPAAAAGQGKTECEVHLPPGLLWINICGSICFLLPPKPIRQSRAHP
jgi:hypothetical protein